MNKKVGFIGCGNMAQAMIGGLIRSNVVPKEHIMASAFSEKTISAVKEDFHINVTNRNEEVAKLRRCIVSCCEAGSISTGHQSNQR